MSRRSGKSRKQQQQREMAGMGLLMVVGAAAWWLRTHPNGLGVLIGFGVGVVVLGIAVGVGMAVYRRRTARQRQLALVRHVTSLEALLALTPKGFEEVIGRLLVELGYREVSVIGKAGDLGVDLTAVTPTGQSAVVQCKRWGATRRVGTPDLQSFIGMAHRYHRAKVGIFVTTATFTPPAVQLGREMGITLMDGHDLTRLFAEVRSRLPVC